VSTSIDIVTAPHKAEPTQRVRARWITGFVFAGFGFQVATQVPSTFTVPQQIKDIDPARHVTDFAWVNSIGALSILLLGPLFGALSDRTAGRHGRRRPWMAAGAVLTALALVLTGTQHNVWGIGFGFFLQCVALAVLGAGITTIVPDQVPVTQRGVVLGWGGVPQAAALIVGGVLVGLVSTTAYVSQYCLLAVLLVFVLLFAARVREVPLPVEDKEPFTWAGFFAGYRIKVREHPDFAWALATRFLMVLGYGLGTLYIPYFLTDVIHYTKLFPGKTDDDGLLLVVAVNSVSTVALVVVSGWLSDRLGRRRVLVCIGSLIMAVAGALLAIHPTWTMTLVAAVILGTGYGVYLSVDGALVTQTLPSDADRGRDMGFAGLMIMLPFALVPLVAALLINYLGGYPALFWTSAASSVAGALCIFKIRGVR
jgi:MFS family permease